MPLRSFCKVFGGSAKTTAVLKKSAAVFGKTAAVFGKTRAVLSEYLCSLIVVGLKNNHPSAVRLSVSHNVLNFRLLYDLLTDDA